MAAAERAPVPLRDPAVRARLMFTSSRQGGPFLWLDDLLLLGSRDAPHGTHIRIAREGSRYRLTSPLVPSDVAVNNRRVEGRLNIVLRHGDEIHFGDQIVRFEQ